jgi:hypothetical protein
MPSNNFSSLQKELNDQGFGQSPTLDYRPSAASYGPGQWQVGDTFYLSDGNQWFELGTNKPVAVPGGFGLTSIPFNIKRAPNGKFSHDFSPLNYKFLSTNVWYVDPVNGNDATGAVNNRSLPLKKLSVALAKSGMNEIRIINLTQDFIARGTDGWNAVGSAWTTSFNVIVEGPFKYLNCSSQSSTQDVYTAHATLAGVYQIASITSNGSSAVDFLNKSTPSYSLPVNQAGPTSIRTEYYTYKKVTSEAEVAATPGTFFCDNTNFFIRPIDDRDLTVVANAATIQRLNTTNGMRVTPAASNINVYVKGIDFFGGRPGYVLNSTATLTTVTAGTVDTNVLLCSNTTGVVVGQIIKGTGIQQGTTVTRIVANTSISLSKPLIAAAAGNYSLYYPGLTVVCEDCSFQAGGTSNGFNVSALATTFLYKCGIYNNLNDGTNYHSPEQDGGVIPDTSPIWYELDCVCKGNGLTGSTATSDNDNTAHDLTLGVSVNCAYLGSSDRTLALTDLAQGWYLGTYIGQAGTPSAATQSVAALSQSKIWLDTCAVLDGTSPKWIAAQTAKIYHYNSGSVVNDVTAEATGQVIPYLG